MTKYYILSILFAFTFIGCNTNDTNRITQSNDYVNYITPSEEQVLNTTTTELTFWTNKLAQTPNQFPYLIKLAAANTKLFQKTGKISYLIDAASNLEAANEKTKHKNAGYLRALARNYISQHRFKEALRVLEKAEVLGEKLHATQKMLFDVHLELGNTKEAEEYLGIAAHKKGFDDLIRLSKWKDHQGNLAGAISAMEKAVKKAEDANNKNLMQWSYTNLADFYGHAGRIKDAYKHYLKALALAPNDAYAKKGIAWIVYSYEKNPKEALRILDGINTQYNAPDYYLLKAEIAEFMGKDAEKEKNINNYMLSVTDKKYGAMYTSHTSTVLAEELHESTQAIALAKHEVQQRSTPQSYALLAWTYFHNGDTKKALKIITEHVKDKTSEPEVLYRMASIYKANGMLSEVTPLKEELLESSFELGPMTTQKVMAL